MNREEAQFLLSAVRSDQIDPGDHEIAEALRLLETDPELQRWYDEALRFDRAVSDRLTEVLPPSDLKTGILTGIRVSRPGPWRRRSVLLIAAACVTLGFLFTSFVGLDSFQRSDGGRVTAAEFTSGMLSAIANLDSLDHQSSNPADIASWLREQGVESTPEITVAAAPGEKDHSFTGCKIIDWQGHKVSLVCLHQLDREGGRIDLHLLTVPAEAVEGLSRDEVIAQLPGAKSPGSGWSTAMWQSGNLVHLLVAEGRHSDPRSLVPFG